MSLLRLIELAADPAQDTWNPDESTLSPRFIRPPPSSPPNIKQKHHTQKQHTIANRSGLRQMSPMIQTEWGNRIRLDNSESGVSD